MKKLLNILIGLIFFSSALLAQNQQEIEVIIQNSNINAIQSILSERQLRLNEFERLKSEKKWPETKEVDGKFFTLVDFDELNQPLYAETLGEKANSTVNAQSLHDGGNLGLNIEGQGFVGAIWEVYAPYHHARTTHDFFQYNGQSRVTLGDYSGVPANYSGHATLVAGSMVGKTATNGCGGQNLSGSAPSASLKSYDINSYWTEYPNAVLNDNLIFCNFSFTDYDNWDYLIYNYPYLVHTISNGNSSLNPAANGSKNNNLFFIGRCYDLNGSENPKDIFPVGGMNSSGSINMSINDNSIISNTINLAYMGSVQPIIGNDVLMTLQVDIDHPNVQDLRLYLVGPNNCGAIEISTNNGGTNADYDNTIFATNGSLPINLAQAPFNDNVFRTEGDFLNAPTGLSGMYSVIPSSTITGCPVIGNWTLYVGDDVTGNQGTLKSWKLNFSQLFPQSQIRIKPDIVTSYFGSGAHSNSNTNIVCNVGGTSFGSPVALGGAMLLQQLYGDYHSPNLMRASTVKALMVNSAREAGVEGPDYSFGYGVMDLQAAAKTIINENLTTRIIENNISNGGTYTEQIYTNGMEPLKASLSWLLPDHTGSLLNDLDIRITTPTGTEYPWRLTSTDVNVSPTKGDNTADNTERIDIYTPSPGYYTITISHKGTLTDGTNNVNSWPFSLVISGISNCSAYSQNTINISTDVLPNNIQLEFALQNIQADNTIEGNATARYVAVEEVLMDGDFEALTDSKFDALIGNCQDAALNKTHNYNPIQREVITFDDKGKVFGGINISNKPLIYPNPNSGGFTINVNGLGYGPMSVMDSYGRLVYKAEIRKGEEIKDIHLSNVSPGIYFLHTKLNNAVYTEKLTIE